MKVSGVISKITATSMIGLPFPLGRLPDSSNIIVAITMIARRHRPVINHTHVAQLGFNAAPQCGHTHRNAFGYRHHSPILMVSSWQLGHFIFFIDI
jgi:hypothetical protein